jgi:hypothetical protein
VSDKGGVSYDEILFYRIHNIIANKLAIMPIAKKIEIMPLFKEN